MYICVHDNSTHKVVVIGKGLMASIALNMLYIVVYFFAGEGGFHSAGTYVITLHHNNMQVTVFMMCFNFT